MFFADRIRSIQQSDRVLEVGPGSSPHPRSDVLLERNFDSAEAAAQRGYTDATDLKKRVVFFDGGRFPFDDREFDYVICSHVLEHVDDVPGFVSELSRVAQRGYLEFPTVYYEYLYNFRVHQNFLHFDGKSIRWMNKGGTALDTFSPVQIFFRNALGAGFDELIASLPCCFFEGFEWNNTISVVEVSNIGELCPMDNAFVFPPNPLKPPPVPGKELVKELARRIKRRFAK